MNQLHILHLEDDATDADLVRAMLAADSIDCNVTRVETKTNFLASIKQGAFDLILADYTLPAFDGLSALQIAQQELPNVPFIFVSGTLDEEVAIEALKVGATDYVFKTRLSRIVPSVRRALLEAQKKVEASRSAEALARALENLERSEDRLRTLVHAISGFVWSAAPDGDVDFVNQRWVDYTGLSLNDSIGSGWSVAIHPDDAGLLAIYWRSLLESGKAGEFEARLRRFDGTYRWFLIRAVPMLDESGRVTKWYGQNTDIEDRKLAESLLAGEKQLLEMVANDNSLTLILIALCKLVETTFSGSKCCISLVDPNAMFSENIIASSPRLYLGAAPSLPKSYTKYMDGRTATTDLGPCAMAATLNQQVITIDIEAETRWQTWRALALSHGLRSAWSTPILSKSGKVLGTLAILEDKSKSPNANDQNLIERFTHIASIAIERALSDAALKRSETFLAKAQSLTCSGSFSWRVATDEITWSEELYRIFEFDTHLLVTPGLIASRVHPEDMPLIQDVIESARAGKNFENRYRLLMPDQSIKYLQLVAHATHDHDGQLEYIGAVQDVTHRQLAEEALGKVRSELAHMARVTSLGALTASIAHEVNQPLLGIITNASTSLRMLAADPPNIDGALETARRTIRDGNRAADVIKRLRALFSRKVFVAESVYLNEAIREVITLTWSELQRNGVILRTELAEGLSAVTGDRVQIQQVILNLLMNASEAMSSIDDRPRQLVIRTDGDERGHVHVHVQDSGIGLASQDMDKLFEAFYTTKSTGMGIGLSVSRSIIESHRGRLWATLHDGPGATFSFSIPSASDDGLHAIGVGASRTPVATNTAYASRTT